MDDKTPFSSIRNGDKSAFDALVRKYNKSLTAFAFRFTEDIDEANDIVQDVFVNIWLKRQRIEFENQIENLLYLTTRNFTYNRLRSAKREAARLNAIYKEDPDCHMDSMIEHETTRLLYEIFQSLPERTAEVLKLTLDGFKQEEIADKMNIAVSSVKTLKAAGIRKLRKLVKCLLLIIHL